MLGHAPLGGRPLGALVNTSMPLVEVVCDTIVEAALQRPIEEIVGDPTNMLVWAVEIEATAIGASATDATIYAATEPFITAAADTPASTPFQGTLQSSLTLRRSVIGRDGFDGYSDSVSELVLINADAEYDTLADGNSINGQPIVCKVGVLGDTYTQFETVANLIGERWRSSRTQVVVSMRDLMARLDVPVQTGIYLGSGELQGGPELAGSRRPRVFGRQDATTDNGGNITPALVIPAEGLFQVNDGAVAAIAAVRDGGIALTFVADYPSVPALRAAITNGTTVPPGSWGSCIAQGYFGIGGVAFKQITCDVVGLTLTTADIIEEVALGAAGLQAADLEAWTFEALNTDQGAEISYYLGTDSSETCRDMFTKLMRGVGGYHGISALGKLQLRRVVAPAGIAAAYYDLDGGNLVEVDREDLPSGIDPPPRRIRVTFARNWTQQTDLFGQVSESDPDFANTLAQPYQTASTPEAASAAILADYPYAPDPAPVESYFVHEADAYAEALRRHALYTAGYKAFRITLDDALFFYDLGEEIAIRDNGIVPRLGLGSYRYCVFLEINDDTKTGFTEAVVYG